MAPFQRSFSIKKLYKTVTGSEEKKKKRVKSVTASPSTHSRALDFTEDAVVDQSCYEETSMRSEHSTLANIRREDIFYELIPNDRNVEEEVRISDLKKCNEELFEINVDLNQKSNSRQQMITALKLKLANERKEAADAQYALLKKHQAELKDKEEELNRKEVEMLKQFSSIKFSENSIPPNQIDALKTSDGLQKVQSTPFAHSTPTSLSKQKKDANNFAVSIPRHHLSPVQESQAIAPVVTSTKIESLLQELITYSFQLRDASNKSSKYVNDWLNNVQPEIAPSNMRANFLEMKNGLEELPKGGIEKVLGTTSRMLKASAENTLQMTHKLKDLKEREDKKEDASIRYESFQDNSMYNDTKLYKF